MTNPLLSVLFSPVYSSTHLKLLLKRERWCAATIGIACMGAICTPATAADLTVKIEGIREARGTIRLELDGSAAAWDNKEKPTALGSTPAVIGAVTYKPTFEESHVDVGDADQHITIHLMHLI